jgi:hypothetical protein
MRGFAELLLAGAMSVALAGPVSAGTSLLGPGYTNWFYACSDGRAMNLAIRHSDGTLTRFSLGPGDSTRSTVERGDLVAWRCGAPVDRAGPFIFIVTLN